MDSDALKLSAVERERYIRHILLREVGGPGQGKIKRTRVLVVGAGGLGAPILLYLAAAGVGHLTVIDDDTVSLSNLQRQIIHADERIGMSKVESAEIGIRSINPHVEIVAIAERLDKERAVRLVPMHDLVIDGSDNFDTRHLVNSACVNAGIPLLSGAISQWEGQLSLYDPANNAPCLACVFPVIPAAGLAPSCAEAGVLGALPGIVGAMVAAEAIKEIVGAGRSLRGRLLLVDTLWGENREVKVQRDPHCKICAGKAYAE